MKKYLLLRDNRQSGPHSIEQLGSIGLLPMDLIWTENESTSWNYPDEIEELKNLIVHDNPQKENEFSRKSEKIFVSLPANFYAKHRRETVDEFSALPVNDAGPVLETNYTRSLEELKENYSSLKQTQPVWNKRMLPTSNIAGVAAVVIGVMVGAFIVKEWVDGYEPSSPVVTASIIPTIDREVEKQPDVNLKNALVTEIVPVYKNTPAKKTKKVNLKKQLQVTTNNYKVGLFGGINGLQLTVFNTSNQVVDKVIVGLDYLKQNGVVVQSENVSFSSIKPKGAKTIAIPGSNRGVKVRYKILKVSSHDYKADLKQI